jgi:amino acid transporter
MTEPTIPTPAGYARRIGLFSATMLVVGGIIGSGIFLNPAIVAQRVGSGRLILLTWGLGAAIALLGAFIFAELGARRPGRGEDMSTSATPSARSRPSCMAGRCCSPSPRAPRRPSR